MAETHYRSSEIAALHGALLEIDHGEVTADAIRSIRSRMLMIHSYQGPGDDWKAQYSLALARSLSKHSVEFDTDVVRIGIDIVWNYFQRLNEQLNVLNASFEAKRQRIINAALEVAQHVAMLSQIKFQFVETFFHTLSGKENPFIVSRSEDGTLSIQADPTLLSACRKIKENVHMETRHCPALASMDRIVDSLYDIFCDYLETKRYRR